MDNDALNGYEPLRNDAAFLNVSARAAIRVTGEDRHRLLHAMSTNHVQGLEPGGGLYVFFLNAQGRILADAYVYTFADSLLLDTEPELRQKLSAHLDKYIIADDVTLDDETERWLKLELAGPHALARAAGLGFPVPDSPYGVLSFEQGWVARVSTTGQPAVRLFWPAAHEETLLQRLRSAGVPEAGAEAAEVVRLEQGQPRYGQDVTERFLVQETGLLHAVHFNKGCYLGQEIVERVRSRAQIHRHLKSLRLQTHDPIAGGTRLLKDGQPAGEITSAAFSPAWDAVAALGYIRTDAAEPGTTLTVAESEPPVQAVVLQSPRSSP